MRAALYGALCLATLCALWEIYARGYPVPGLLLLPLAAGLLWQLRRDPGAGAQLCWRAGQWTLEQNGVPRGITLGRRCTATRWVVYLAFTDRMTGRGGILWLYADSIPQQQMRQLRVRLTLMH